MQIAGIIAEYNPLHGGHVHLLEETRRRLGPECAIICAMSGNFVQRGDFAIVGKYARAEAAVRSGADLVLELPLPWAVASAERFADGGVQTLLETGLVTHLAFGSECGAAQPLARLAAVLTGESFSQCLREELSAPVSFATARQRAAERLLSREDAALLRSPNNSLGVEYCKSVLRHGARLQVVTVARKGTAHDAPLAEGELPSATAIRARIQESAQALSLMAPAMAQTYAAEAATGRAPVLAHTCERAILARLRTMEEAEFARLDEGREGLYRRLYAAARTASSVEQVLSQTKTKRYAYARLRRMVLWAYLGLTPGDCPPSPPYLRPLAANETGRKLLAQMRGTAAVPILTKPAAVRRMGADAKTLFELESRASDLYALAYPDLALASGGSAWREGPVMC